MGITLEMQLEFFIWSVITGLFAGLLYDCFRTIRVMMKSKNGAIIAHDIIFLVLMGIVIFILSFTAGRGELRFFEFAAILCGFVLYRFAFKDSVVKLLTAFVNFLIKVVIIIIKIMIFPLKIFYKVVIKPINIIIWYVRRKAKKGGSALKVRRERWSRGIKNFMLNSRKK